MLIDDVVKKSGALIDPEQAANAPGHPADDASNHGAHRSSRGVSVFHATIDAVADALRASADRDQEEKCDGGKFKQIGLHECTPLPVGSIATA